MKRLETPPNPFDPARVTKAVAALGTPEVTAFVDQANREYYHWDELRRQTPPLDLTPDQAWAAVKFSRLARKNVPLLDVTNKPFSYWLPDRAYETLHVVDRRGGGVMATDTGEPDVFAQMRDRVLIDSLMEEAIATSQIEGAVTTRKVAKELLRSGRSPKDRSERMIVNGYRTIRLIRQRAGEPLTVPLLHEIQESMTRDTLESPDDAGRFRRAGDDVRIVDARDGEDVFVPPPAERLEERIAVLLRFANAAAEQVPFIHPLVRAATLHFWLAYEHPYADGNGRTARALFYWSMLKSGYWLFEFLTISRVIVAAPMKYYRSFLYSETDDNDLTYFLMYQFHVTRRALAELHERIGEMRQQQERVHALRLTERLNVRQKALVDHALRHPIQIYTIESHQRSHGISYETARSDLLLLLERGLLSEVGGRRPRQFTPAGSLARRLKHR